MVRVTARQLRDRNCLAARLETVSRSHLYRAMLAANSGAASGKEEEAGVGVPCFRNSRFGVIFKNPRRNLLCFRNLNAGKGGG